MTVVATKISLYGDSASWGPAYAVPGEVTDGAGRFSPTMAQRIVTRSAGKIAGANDYSRGGNSFAFNLAGEVPGNGTLFGGLSFQDHVLGVDDCDICVIRLGGNSVPGGWLIGGDLQDALGADYLNIASDCLRTVQYARAAGKRPVLVGTPYTNAASGCSWYNAPSDRIFTEAQRMRNANTAVRCVSGLVSALLYPVPIIITHGYGGAGGNPIPSAADVPDGVHPRQAYYNAVSDYVADQIISIFGL